MNLKKYFVCCIHLISMIIPPEGRVMIGSVFPKVRKENQALALLFFLRNANRTHYNYGSKKQIKLENTAKKNFFFGLLEPFTM